MSATTPAAMPLRRLGLITSQAFSLHNFRGSLIREWVARGIQVIALAPDYDAASRAAVRALGAEPVAFRLERASIRPLQDIREVDAAGADVDDEVLVAAIGRRGVPLLEPLRRTVTR